ncbi:MAG: type 4a pilus biogenesis protein PilO [Candidatus Omnitrophica bacterium]|nr:type 4a pilus biogenesis protein PilO [Candidatus Omnitrophota bacterium]
MINLADKIKSIKFLNQLELDNKKIMLILLVSAVVLYIDFSFILKFQLQGLKKSGAEITRLKKDLGNFKKDSKNMQDLKSRQDVSIGKQDIKVKKIISENQFGALLQDISKLANNNDVRILQLKPSREAQGTVKSLGSLTPFFIMMDLSCGYHNLGKFINELENLRAFVGINSLKIDPFEDNYVKQRVSLTLYTYVKK